jgi:hypothetical protein
LGIIHTTSDFRLNDRHCPDRPSQIVMVSHSAIFAGYAGQLPDAEHSISGLRCHFTWPWETAMTLDSAISRRLFGLFLLGFILFNYPILSIFNLETFLFGIPMLYLYVFSVWMLLIILIVFVTRVTRFRDTLPSSPSRQPKGLKH